ncbi:unnamed protein product [Vitrella brassicaformis CCMP3155]|uniref:Uncharacterized protein n=1 Tax=Vitrella brassicaformis (strain CCMP3155) TaxID=1169540 RepID=A0A0G4F172_VITBC|nr:unnamed protein product [Vitrella brassicaformis CCMP3155]|eukprot:CEM05453.1 unnamed protein product [Vitrella brassicaformis CCMP3155]
MVCLGGSAGAGSSLQRSGGVQPSARVCLTAAEIRKIDVCLKVPPDGLEDIPAVAVSIRDGISSLLGGGVRGLEGVVVTASSATLSGSWCPTALGSAASSS